MSSIESLIKALDVEYKKSNFFKNLEKNRKRNKRVNKNKKKHRYIEIRRTKYDSVTVKCESFCRKPVYIVITNFSQYNSLYSAFKEYIENRTWGHGQRLLEKILEKLEKSNKIEKELNENSFVKIKLR